MNWILPWEKYTTELCWRIVCHMVHTCNYMCMCLSVCMCMCESACVCSYVCVHPDIHPLHILLGLSAGQYHLSAVQRWLVTQHWRQMKCSADNQLCSVCFWSPTQIQHRSWLCPEPLLCLLPGSLTKQSGLSRADFSSFSRGTGGAGNRKQTHCNMDTSKLDMQSKIRFFARRNNLIGWGKPQWVDQAVVSF